MEKVLLYQKVVKMMRYVKNVFNHLNEANFIAKNSEV